MSLSWFLLVLLLPWDICNNLYRDRASDCNKTSYNLTHALLPFNIVPRHAYYSKNSLPGFQKSRHTILYRPK